MTDPVTKPKDTSVMEAARRIVEADVKQRRERASMPNTPGIMISGKVYVAMADHITSISAALAINAPFRIDAPAVARALIRMQESNRTLANALERLLYAVNGINQGGMAIAPEEMAETNRDCQEVHRGWANAT